VGGNKLFCAAALNWFSATLTDSCWLRIFGKHATHHLNDEYEQRNKDFTICYLTFLIYNRYNYKNG